MVDSRNCHEQSVRVLSDDCYEMSYWENVMSNYVSKLEKEYTKKQIDALPLTNVLVIDRNIDVTADDVIILSSKYKHDRDNFVKAENL